MFVRNNYFLVQFGLQEFLVRILFGFAALVFDVRRETKVWVGRRDIFPLIAGHAYTHEIGPPASRVPSVEMEKGLASDPLVRISQARIHCQKAL